VVILETGSLKVFVNIIPEWYLSVNYFTYAHDVTNFMLKTQFHFYCDTFHVTKHNYISQQKPNCCFSKQLGYCGCMQLRDYPSYANSNNAVIMKYLMGCW